ncbi:MAG: RsmD family RNA methyltransferase [Polaromonas sp.]|nr:RsmD family RNA methyltransferase [Polaromonas sp.]
MDNGSAPNLAVAHFPGLRPTPDRVRETLSNWLGQDAEWMHVSIPSQARGTGL